MDKIRVSVQDYDEPISAVRVDGVVDTLTSGEVDRAICGLLDRQRSQIVMDLAGVDYISSAGWGVFIAHLKSVRSQAGDVRLSGMIPNVREIYELLEFDTVLSSYETSQQAINSFETRERHPEGGPHTPTASSGGLEELSAIGVDAPSVASGQNRADVEAVDSGSGSGRGAGSLTGSKSSNPSFASDSSDPDAVLLELVADDPFASIGELRDSLNSRGGSPPVGWWTVFGLLRKHGLLRRRSRFQLSRRGSTR